MTENPSPSRPHAATESPGVEPGAPGNSLDAFLGVVASPQRCFAIIRDRKPWFGAFAALLVVAVLNTWSLLPLTSTLTRSQLERTFGDNQEQVDLLMQQIENPLTQAIAIGTATGQFAISVLAPALFVWLLAAAFKGQLRFGQAFSLLLHLRVITTLQALASTLILHLRGADSLKTPTDLVVAMGLNRFLTSENPFLDAIYASVNPFNIWFLALLALGASAIGGLPRRQSFLLAGVYWMATTALAAAQSTLASRLMPG